MIEVRIDSSAPTPAFWRAYAALWENSAGKPAFQSPCLLQYFTGRVSRPPAAFQGFRDGKLYGAVVLNRSNRHVSFLSDLKTDHNFFVFDRACGEEEIRMFFTGFLEVIRKAGWMVTLNN